MAAHSIIHARRYGRNRPDPCSKLCYPRRLIGSLCTGGEVDAAETASWIAVRDWHLLNLPMTCGCLLVIGMHTANQSFYTLGSGMWVALCVFFPFRAARAYLPPPPAVNNPARVTPVLKLEPLFHPLSTASDTRKCKLPRPLNPPHSPLP